MTELFVEKDYLQDLNKRKIVVFLNEKSKFLAALAQATIDTDFQKLLAITVNAPSL